MPPRTRDPVDPAALRVVPANRASADDLAVVFGTRGDPSWCWCQHFKVVHRDTHAHSAEQRREMLHEQTRCGSPRAGSTSGLVAFLDDEPVGWVAVEPRTAYPRLLDMKVPWAGREEDPDDDSVWAVTCFVVRAGYRRRGIAYALAAATVPFARDRGARALEGYPMVVAPGADITWGEVYVGTRQVFDAAGFTEVSHPFKRRVVMRIDL